ncbi:MAG TPA: glycogen synthase GlgA [Gammaproteobacteria bacterium]|nr:glycogen synthase GlgA [Gammaproteobacteria bacterium]
MSLRNILFATSEAHPLIKTGGLADVSGSLPVALRAMRRDVRIVLPGYRSALAQAGRLEEKARFTVHGFDNTVTIREGRLPGSRVVVWLVDSPPHFDRPGGPYVDERGRDWPDNAQRFTVFARAVEKIALNEAGLDWQPDVVHCNDWQTGLVPALLAPRRPRPATVFTIHNLAYQGLFSWDEFQTLHLPQTLWSMHAMEFYGRFSFIKGGIVFADMINTVSPRYAQEITTPEFGCGLEDLLRSRADRLVGILNGADYSQWNPARDPYLKRTYNAYTVERKADNKVDLQARFQLPLESATPLLGLIGRLVEQKGFDLLLAALPQLLQRKVQIVVLGSGDKSLEARLKQATRDHARQLAAYIGYDEPLAHQIEGGADMFLMPSRYEPCGLNQIYSLRYGTLPIVHRTGGLANTVVDANEKNIANRTATGIVFDEPTPEALLAAVDRALALYRQPRLWKKVIFNGMQQDFSWRRSARQYLSLYQKARQMSL